MCLIDSRDIDTENFFSYELAPVPTSMFEDNGDMRLDEIEISTEKQVVG